MKIADALNRQEITQLRQVSDKRYEMPLPQQASKVAELEAKVNAHLDTMGFAI